MNEDNKPKFSGVNENASIFAHLHQQSIWLYVYHIFLKLLVLYGCINEFINPKSRSEF